MGRSAPWERDGTADDVDTQLEDESDEDFEKRLAAWDDDLDTPVMDDDDDEEEATDSDPNVSAVIDYIGAQEELKAARAAEREAFNATVEENMPDYQPPVRGLTEMETAAQQAAGLVGTNNYEEFAQMLREATAKQEREARAGEGGYDAEGDAVVERWSPAGLDSASFGLFMEAIASGGASADPRKIPQGETYDTWSAKINSALGR